MEKVSQKFFSRQTLTLPDCVRIAQIAATLGAQLTDSFKYVTQDLHLHSANDNVLLDNHSDLNTFVNQDWYQKHILHKDYLRSFVSCSENDWNMWAKSEKSCLSTFVPLVQNENRIWGENNLKNFLNGRAFAGNITYRYQNVDFLIFDWDFEKLHWAYWEIRQEEDEKYWVRLLSRIIYQPSTNWTKALSARLIQRARNGNTNSITSDSIVPEWIIKFRGLACLEDTRGVAHQPA